MIENMIDGIIVFLCIKGLHFYINYSQILDMMETMEIKEDEIFIFVECVQCDAINWGSIYPVHCQLCNTAL